MQSPERMRIDYDPIEKVHKVYFRNVYYTDPSCTKTYEDWEPLFPIEEKEDWEEEIIKLIRYWIDEDKES